ncbi:MAG: ABC transporter substrate-binding protein [Rhodospirillales bacterium]
MNGFTRRTMLAGTGAAAAGIALWRFTSAANAQSELLLGVPTDNSNSLPMMIAAAGGFLKEEGINARVTTGAAGTNTRQMIAAGQMPYAIGDIIHPLYLTGAGKPAKVLMVIDKRASITMMVTQELWDKGVRTVEQVGQYKKADGSKPQIGVTRIGAQTWLYGAHMLLKAGYLDNVNFVALGDTGTTMGAFKSGRVDAVMANTLVYFAIIDEKLGQPVFNATDGALWDKFFGGSFSGQGVFGLEEQVKADPKLAQGVVNAVFRSLRYLDKAKPADIYAKVDGKFMTSFKPEVAVREIEFLKPLFSDDGVITKAQWENGGKVWFSEATKVKPQTFEAIVDLSFLKNAQKKYG